MSKPGPIGLQTGVHKGASQGVRTKELNAAGDFAWNPAISDADEIGELLANRWSPSTDDCVAVPGGTVVVAPTFGAICLETDGSLSRINIFTHANTGMIAFGGHIEKRAISRTHVFLNVNGRAI
jgi:hypothetical protein